MSTGIRIIVFDVAGEIKLTSDIWVKGSFLSSDGTTAPSQGITLKNGALLIHGDMKAHDIVVRGIRSCEAKGCDTCATTGADMSLGRNAYNVVIDCVSVAKAQDQAISVNRGAHDVAIQRSILAESRGPTGANLPVLIDTNTKRVSMHHTLFIKGYERLPRMKYSDSGTQVSDTQLDSRENLVYNQTDIPYSLASSDLFVDATSPESNDSLPRALSVIVYMPAR